MTKWNDLLTTSRIGTRESLVKDIKIPHPIARATAKAVASIPAGTSLMLETNLSIDNGVTWLGWKTVPESGDIPDITPLVTDLTNAVIMARCSLSSTVLDSPQVDKLTLDFIVAYPSSASWLSPVLDLRAMMPMVTELKYSMTKANSTDARVQVRTSYDGVNWESWQDTDGKTFPQIGLYTQVRALLKADPTREYTPNVKSVNYTLWDYLFRGEWVSEVVDLTKAKNKASGKAVLDHYSGGGAVTIQSRSKDSLTSGVWSAWFNAEADGTLIHPAASYMQLRIIASGGDSKVHELTLSIDGSPVAAELMNNMSPGAEYSFATLRDMLIIMNGKDLPRKWDGLTPVPSVLGGDAPVMQMVTVHHNRVWAVEADNPSRVRFSDILDPEKWSVLNFIDFNPEDGDRITAIYRYGQNLIVSKQRSMAILTGNTSSNYSVMWLDNEQGCSGARGITQADKYVAYVSQDGIRFTDLNTSVISTERLLPDWERLNHRRLNQAAIVYWRHFLLAALPSNGSLVNDQLWVFDFLRNAWAIYKGWEITSFLKFSQYGDEILLGSSSKEGQVYTLLAGDTDDGVTIGYEWQSKDFDFGYPERYKIFRGIYLDIEATMEDTHLSVDLIVDGVVAGTYETDVPAGEGMKVSRRILPPLYNAVLGRSLSLNVKGRCGIQKITIEYIVRGVVPTEDF